MVRPKKGSSAPTPSDWEVGQKRLAPVPDWGVVKGEKYTGDPAGRASTMLAHMSPRSDSESQLTLVAEAFEGPLGKSAWSQIYSRPSPRLNHSMPGKRWLRSGGSVWE